MNDKIITKLDTNLITYSQGAITSENIARNELLIKELITTINQNNKYIDRDEMARYQQYLQVTEQVDKLLRATNKQRLDEVAELILQLVSSRAYLAEEKNNTLDTMRAEIENIRCENKIQLATITERNEQEIANLTAKLLASEENLKRMTEKYNAQKNRKAVRFADKLVRR